MRQQLNAGEWVEIAGSRVDVFDADGNLVRSADAEGLAEQSQIACNVFAIEQQAEIDRQIALEAPIAPLPISGTTVAAVKASADASVKDLASQMQAKIDAILGGS